MANTTAIVTKPNPGRAGGVTGQPDTQARVAYMLDAANFRKGEPTKRPVIESVRSRAGELLRSLASGLSIDAGNDAFMHRLEMQAKDCGMNLSQFLEACDPSENYTGPEAKMDAYERQLMVHGIRVKSDPKKGIFADKVERFFASNQPGSQVLFPEFINRVMRETPISPSILPFMVAVTSGIDGGVYRPIYTNDTATDRRMWRAGENSPFPKTTLSTAEKTIRIHKVGKELEGSYEFFRAVRIDLFSVFLRRIALQADLDEADIAADAVVNGDGNSNSATNYNQSTLDTGTTPTYKAFVAFCAKFYPLGLRVLIGNEASLTNFLAMSRPSIDPFQVLALLQQNYMVEQQIKLPQGIYTSVTLLLLPNMSTGVYLGLDERFAIEQVIENGSNLVETEKFIQTQKNSIVISKRVGFARLLNEAGLTWTWNA